MLLRHRREKKVIIVKKYSILSPFHSDPEICPFFLSVRIKLSLNLIDYTVKHNATKNWEMGISSANLDLSARWRCVVSFTSWPLYSQGKPAVPMRNEARWAPVSVHVCA